jgi:hypothetical protein
MLMQRCRVSLGSLIIDNKRVRIDENSYFEMDEKDNAGDLERCDKEWKTGKVKKVKCEEFVEDANHENDENNPPVPGNFTGFQRKYKQTHHVVEMKVKATMKKEDDKEGTMLCELCEEDPCMWISKGHSVRDAHDKGF